MKLETLAAIVTVMGGLLTVIYTDAPFDLWDMLIGFFVGFVCWSYRTELSKDRRAFFIARIGLAIAIAIIIMAAATLIAEFLGRSMPRFKTVVFDDTLLLAIFIFAISFTFYKISSPKSSGESVQEA